MVASLALRVPASCYVEARLPLHCAVVTSPMTTPREIISSMLSTHRFTHRTPDDDDWVVPLSLSARGSEVVGVFLVLSPAMHWTLLNSVFISSDLRVRIASSASEDDGSFHLEMLPRDAAATGEVTRSCIMMTSHRFGELDAGSRRASSKRRRENATCVAT